MKNEEWIVPMAISEFRKKLRNGAAAIDKRRLLEVWLGYAQRGCFDSFRDPAVETLEAFVKFVRPHFRQKRHWKTVKEQITDLLVAAERIERPKAETRAGSP